MNLLLLKLYNRFFLKNKTGKLKYQPLFEYLDTLAMEGKHFGHIGSVAESGEVKVVELLNKENDNDIVIFDVGANVGQYQSALLKTLSVKNFNIHCFEPSPATFNVLKKNTTDPRVKINNFGLGDKKEQLSLYRTGELSPLSSLYKKGKDDYYNIESMEQVETVDILTLDDYCKTMNIHNIHLLKMDVEGHELNVLIGAKEMLTNKKIKYIQMEFGPTNIDSKTYFRDFFRLLSNDYSFFRIVSDGFYKIEKYSETEEIFFPVNYLLILK